MADPKLTQPMEQYKREHWAALLRVPMSGNAELDAMIREARRWDMATKIYAETRALSPQDCIEEAEQVLRRLSAPRTEGGAT